MHRLCNIVQRIICTFFTLVLEYEKDYKAQVGNGQEKVQSERNSHSKKTEVGKN